MIRRGNNSVRINPAEMINMGACLQSSCIPHVETTLMKYLGAVEDTLVDVLYI